MSIGEQTGGLETMLRQVADYNEKELVTRKGIKGAMMYPIIAMVACVAGRWGADDFCFAGFRRPLRSTGRQTAALTMMMLDLSAFLKAYYKQILLVLLGIAGFALIYFKTNDGKYNWIN